MAAKTVLQFPLEIAHETCSYLQFEDILRMTEIGRFNHGILKGSLPFIVNRTLALHAQIEPESDPSRNWFTEQIEEEFNQIENDPGNPAGNANRVDRIRCLLRLHDADKCLRTGKAVLKTGEDPKTVSSAAGIELLLHGNGPSDCIRKIHNSCRQQKVAQIILHMRAIREHPHHGAQLLRVLIDLDEENRKDKHEKEAAQDVHLQRINFFLT